MRETIQATPQPNPKTHAAVTGGGSLLGRYQAVIVGRSGLGRTLYFEWCAWLAIVPGALGLALRKLFWPRLFGSCGRGVQFAGNIVLRHPHRIHLGDRVVLSERCLLDARNAGTDRAIEIGDDGIVSNDVMIQCKGSSVAIGARAGIGPQTVILSAGQGDVTIGNDVIIGPRCFIISGGNYNIDRTDIPIAKQGIKPDTGVTLGDDIWFGANVSALSGITIGSGAIAAAGAVLTRSVPAMSISVGVPAKVVKQRDA